MIDMDDLLNDWYGRPGQDILDERTKALEALEDEQALEQEQSVAEGGGESTPELGSPTKPSIGNRRE